MPCRWPIHLVDGMRAANLHLWGHVALVALPVETQHTRHKDPHAQKMARGKGQGTKRGRRGEGAGVSLGLGASNFVQVRNA
jgi:hypothetical protein